MHNLLENQFGFSNYPAFKRTFSQNKLTDPFRFENSTFTDFCISRQLSHFAAFFIDARAKISTVESCLSFFGFPSFEVKVTLQRLKKRYAGVCRKGRV